LAACTGGADAGAAAGSDRRGSNGGKPHLPLPPFVLAQGIVGCLIAKMVPLSIVGDVASHWFLFTSACWR
jgi:uncharacterized membrane protein AbrB (regulator of aidB expression)